MDEEPIRAKNSGREARREKHGGRRTAEDALGKKTTSLARNARLAVVYIKQQLDTLVTCYQATIPRGYPLEERGCLDGFTTRISPSDVSKYIPLERR